MFDHCFYSLTYWNILWIGIDLILWIELNFWKMSKNVDFSETCFFLTKRGGVKVVYWFYDF